MKEEHKRKVRICAGGFQAIVKLRSLLNFLRYPALSFQYISHRVLRWTLSPLSLPILLVSNILLLLNGGGWFYQAIFAMQVLFYAAAWGGYFMALQNRRMKLLYIPYYFLFMNVAVYEGFFRFIGRRQPSTWEKAVRVQEKISDISI